MAGDRLRLSCKVNRDNVLCPAFGLADPPLKDIQMQTSLPLFNCNSTPDMQPAEKPRVSGRRSASVSIRYESRQASQQQLAERLGPTQQAYAHWERNTVALRPEQLLSLAEAS